MENENTIDLNNKKNPLVAKATEMKGAVKGMIDSTINADASREGSLTSKVENQTAKAPSMFWFGMAVGSMAASAVLIATKKKEYANFVGMWAPCFLLIGIYNKLVKLEGNERSDDLDLSRDSGVAIH